MSTHPFNNLQPGLTALTEEASSSSIHAQQALVTFVFSAAQAQFGLSRGLAEDMTEAFKTTPTTNPVATTQTLVTRWHDRAEQAISEFRRIGDELRNSLYQATAKPLAQATAVATAPAETVKEATKTPTQPTVQPKNL